MVKWKGKTSSADPRGAGCSLTNGSLSSAAFAAAAWIGKGGNRLAGLEKSLSARRSEERAAGGCYGRLVVSAAARLATRRWRGWRVLELHAKRLKDRQCAHGWQGPAHANLAEPPRCTVLCTCNSPGAAQRRSKLEHATSLDQQTRLDTRARPSRVRVLLRACRSHRASEALLTCAGEIS